MDKKEQILNAATECFMLFGYEKTSMSDIGKRVGLNKASLYYHYKDKLAIFEAMVQSKKRVHRRMQRNLVQAEALGIPQIIAFLSSEMGFIEELALNFLAPPTTNQGGKDDTMTVYQAIIEEELQLLAELIEAAKSDGLFLKVDPPTLARQVLQTCRGLLLVDCPLDAPLSERGAGYARVRKDIEEIIPMLLRGAA